MRRLLLLLCLALPGGLLAADPAPVALRHETLTLTDGRVLHQVTIKSYDARTGKLLLLADGKALSLPIALVPEPLAAQLKDGAPKAGGTTSSTAERVVYAPVVLPNGPGGAPKVMAHAVLTAEQKLQGHKDSARLAARNQTLSKYWTGNVRKVEIRRCEPDEPVAAEGWIDRYKTRVAVTYDCLDAAGVSLSQGTIRYEITTEFPPNRSNAGILNCVELK